MPTEENTPTVEDANAENTVPAFEPITSQEALDKIVGHRLERERKKYADYEDLRKQAERASGLQEELDQANKRITEFETREQHRSWVLSVSAEFGVPADALRGSTLEELQTHAGNLKRLIQSELRTKAQRWGATPRQRPTFTLSTRKQAHISERYNASMSSRVTGRGLPGVHTSANASSVKPSMPSSVTPISEIVVGLPKSTVN